MPTLSECGRGYCRSNPDSFPCRVFNQLLAASRVFFFSRETPPGTESVSRSPDNPNNEVNFSLRAPSPGRGWALLNYANTFREVALNFKFVHADAFFFSLLEKWPPVFTPAFMSSRHLLQQLSAMTNVGVFQNNPQSYICI